MEVILYLPTGVAQELTEAEVFELNILARPLMGLYSLGAAINKVMPVLKAHDVDTLAQASNYAAYGVSDAADFELPVNKQATARVQELTGRRLEEPLCGPILVIEAKPAGRAPRPLSLF